MSLSTTELEQQVVENYNASLKAEREILNSLASLIEWIVKPNKRDLNYSLEFYEKTLAEVLAKDYYRLDYPLEGKFNSGSIGASFTRLIAQEIFLDDPTKYNDTLGDDKYKINWIHKPTTVNEDAKMDLIFEKEGFDHRKIQIPICCNLQQLGTRIDKITKDIMNS